MKDSFNELPYQELLTKREELRKSYRDLRFNMVLSHVDNPLAKRMLRQRLARLYRIAHRHRHALDIAGQGRGQLGLLGWLDRPRGGHAAAGRLGGSRGGRAAIQHHRW